MKFLWGGPGWHGEGEKGLSASAGLSMGVSALYGEPVNGCLHLL